MPFVALRYGGWENETLIELFTDYAKECFEAFGDRVSMTSGQQFIRGQGEYDVRPAIYQGTWDVRPATVSVTV